jgi:hypothetical protein
MCGFNFRGFGLHACVMLQEGVAALASVGEVVAHRLADVEAVTAQAEVPEVP